MFVPELLSPAGSLKNMRYAFAYGADAVYAGQPRYSLRVRNNQFNHENLSIGINEAHRLGKKFYVVVNIAPHNSKLTTFIADLQPVINMHPDALIMSDPGLIMLVREYFPHMEIHLSVQANTVNWATAKFWRQMGVTRIVLSRELSLEEIAEIRQAVPDVELEVFVHGALCMAYSGRCLLSGYINKRDANQGTCTNACRWKYNVVEAKEDRFGNIVQHPAPSVSAKREDSVSVSATADPIFMLKEPGSSEYMSAFEDEHGTYIMNSKDLRAIALVDSLVKIGVHSLKIEGRTKSFYYCARTAQAYRKAIDDAVLGQPFDIELFKTLDALSNRGYTEGFLRRHRHGDLQNYEYGYSTSNRQQFIGEFTGKMVKGCAEVLVKNKFFTGDKVEMITPKGSVDFVLETIQDDKGQLIKAGLGDGHTVYLAVPDGLPLEYGLLARYLQKSTTTRQPYK